MNKKKKKVLSERELLEFTRCPLRIFPFTAWQPSVDEQKCDDLVRWILLESVRNGTPSPAEIRTHLPELAQQQVEVWVPRLQKLGDSYMVVHPVAPYMANLGQISVKGEYAVVQDLSYPDVNLILRIRKGESSIWSYPDVVSYARYLHLNHFANSQQPVKLLQFCLDQEKQWIESYTAEGVQRYLAVLAENILEQRSFPAPGPHCYNCQTVTCVEHVHVVRPNADYSSPY